MSSAYIGLGSNLDDPEEQLHAAVHGLRSAPQCCLLRASPVYSSRPMGPQDQGDFLNAVVLLETALQPLELLDLLQRIELEQCRERTRRWGPRTLDLDLLLYDDIELVSERLTVPHPGLGQRDFVLRPLRDVANDNLLLPNGADLDTLLGRCPSHDLVHTNICLGPEHRAVNGV